jgi:hypothetical protein
MRAQGLGLGVPFSKSTSNPTEVLVKVGLHSSPNGETPRQITCCSLAERQVPYILQFRHGSPTDCPKRGQQRWSGRFQMGGCQAGCTKGELSWTFIDGSYAFSDSSYIDMLMTGSCWTMAKGSRFELVCQRR